MKKYFATLLAAVSLLTVSCSKDDDPTTGSSENNFLLKKGFQPL